MSKISIICSNYNSDRWIDDYLNYLNEQIDRRFTVIFIDANSTDESLSKIKKFSSSTDIEVKILECKERIGVYAAWNLGIKSAETEYIMNYNTDDMLYRYAISVYNSYLDKYPEIDLFYGPCGFVKTRNISDYTSYINWPEYSHEIMMHMCIGGPFPLLKKKVFEEIGYFDESFVSSGDYEMWARMSKQKRSFKKIPEAIGSFYLREDSVHSSNAEKARQEDQFIQTKYKI